MPNDVARFLSYVLHPLLMPFYAIVLVMNLNTYIAFSSSIHVQRIIITLVFITTGALPVLTAFILMQKGMIRSFEMQTINERRIPFITTAGYYIVCFYLLQQLPVPRMLSLMVLGAAITIVIAWILSFKWKVSIHMIGIGGLTGMLFAISQILNANLLMMIIFSVIVSGLLGSARLQLGAHTPKQVYIGYLIGFLTEVVVISVLSN